MQFGQRKTLLAWNGNKKTDREALQRRREEGKKKIIPKNNEL